MTRRKKTRSIKESKKKMPRGLQVANIARYLGNRGIQFEPGELDDLVDGSLHYDENLAEVKRIVGTGRSGGGPDELNFIIDQAKAINQQRTMQAQLQDYHLVAGNTFTPKQIANDPELFEKWLSSPNRYDIVGVDVPEGTKPSTTKRTKKDAGKGVQKVKPKLGDMKRREIKAEAPLGEGQQYHIVEVRDGYTDKFLARASTPEKAETEKKYWDLIFKKHNYKDVNVEIIAAKNMAEVRAILYARGKHDYEISGTSYPDRHRMRALGLRWDRDRQSWRGKLTPEKAKELEHEFEVERTETEFTEEERKAQWREKQARKAEKYREWAEGQRAKSDEASKRAHAITDNIPMGQPILVGHHSEGRHRRDLAKADSAMRSSVDHYEKAEEMERKADTLERRAGYVKGDIAKQRENMDEKVKATLKVGSWVESPMIREGAAVLKLNKKTATVKTAAGYTSNEPYHWLKLKGEAPEGFDMRRTERKMEYDSKSGGTILKAVPIGKNPKPYHRKTETKAEVRKYPQCQCPGDCKTCKDYPRSESFKSQSCEDYPHWRTEKTQKGTLKDGMTHQSVKEPVNKSKILPDMELQQTLGGKGGQIHFKSEDPLKHRKTTKPTDHKTTRVKKGSDNLSTFGIQDPEQRSILPECII